MLKKIPVTELRLGMFIDSFCGSWMEHPFWKAKFLLKNSKDFERILDSGVAELWIDTSKGLDIEAGHPQQSEEQASQETEAQLQAASAVQTPAHISLDTELERARQLCSTSKQAVMEMFGEARMGKAIDAEKASDLVGQISESVLRHPHALLSLARLKNADEYTYMHSVAVGALMIALAKQLGLSADKIHEAGIAGLLHDVGKMAIDMEIINKPGQLTDPEFATVRKHPELGEQLLRASGKVSEPVLDVCLHHHEKFDGSGYPHRLAGEQISVLARMGAACDVYDAITSDRPYKRGWNPTEAIRKMASWKGHFDPRIFQAFVKSVGIYPTGSLVRLESQKLAVVLEQNDSSLLTPQVKVFFSARSKVPIPQEVLDLAKVQDKIIACEDPEAWNFRNLEQLWGGQIP